MVSARRIDFHFHLIPKFYQDAAYESDTGPAIGRYPDWSPERALELMDAHSIEVALTSLAQPGVQFGSPEHGRALARRCNDYAAELAARWPRRFGGFAVVPILYLRYHRGECAGTAQRSKGSEIESCRGASSASRSMASAMSLD